MGLFKLAVTGESSTNNAGSVMGKYQGSSSVNQTVKSYSPVTPLELKLVYERDGITFNSINTLKRIITSAGYEVIADTKKTANYYDGFLKNIGNVGEEMTDQELFDLLFLHQLAYGNAFVFLIESKDKIVDLMVLDPVNVQLLKNSDDTYALDSYGNPYGITLKVESNFYKQNPFFAGDPLPPSFQTLSTLDANTIFIKYDRIAHFKINAIDKYWGIGFIEPSYSSIISKMNIESGQANSIYKNGFSPLIGYVGGPKKVATPKDLDWVNKLLAELDSSKVGAFPDWVKVDSLKYEQSSVVSDTLDYFRINGIASTGMPLALASGKGDATNRSTLIIHLQLLQKNLGEIVNKTVSTFERFVFKRIAEKNGNSEIAHIKWGPLGMNETELMVKTILEGVKDGIYLAEDAKVMLSKILGMSVDG